MAKLKTILRHITPLFRWKKPVNNIEIQFEVINAIEALEGEDKIMVVPGANPQDEVKACGIVIGKQYAMYLHACYITRMAYWTRQYGGLEKFLHAKHTLKKFSSKHDPDQELKQLIMGARMVASWRLALRGLPYLTPEDPFFISMMGEGNEPDMVGYEKNGEIVIEKADLEDKPLQEQMTSK